MPEEAIDRNEDVFELWDINAKAMTVFLGCATQWRVVALSTTSSARLIRLGLDYAGVQVVMAKLGMKDRKGRIFADIQILEHCAVQAFDEAQS